MCKGEYRMPGTTAILFAALFVLCSTENSLQRFESECRPEVGWDPCQRACEFEKMGLTSEGKFDIGKTRAMIDQGGLKLYPDDRRNLLKAAFHVCHAEVAPDRSLDRCAAASAIYYCVNALLRPEVLYKDEVRAIRRWYHWKY